MICSTLSGKLSIKHPRLGVLVREDGAVLWHAPVRQPLYRYTYGTVCSSNGYLELHSKRLGQHLIHRLVCECFHSNPDDKPTVDHINRIRTDNRAENLRWATRKEQCENNSFTLAHKGKYGVRYCEDKKQYCKKWRLAHKKD